MNAFTYLVFIQIYYFHSKYVAKMAKKVNQDCPEYKVNRPSVVNVVDLCLYCCSPSEFSLR